MKNSIFISALGSARHLSLAETNLNRSIERLSSGLRINSAQDDATGIAISERFTAQIRGLNQATQNANDGVSMLQTADGALTQYQALCNVSANFLFKRPTRLTTLMTVRHCKQKPIS